MTSTDTPSALPTRLGRVLAPRMGYAVGALMLVVGFFAASSMSQRIPGGLGALVAAAAFGVVLVVVGLRDPVWAFVFVIVTLFFRLATPHVPPTNPFLVAFGGIVLSTLIWIGNDPSRRIHVGVLELTMVLYLIWNVHSMLSPHDYTPVVAPLTGELLPVWRYILIGTAMPFAMYVIGRAIFVTERGVKIALYAVLACSTYSAYVSIMQFDGPRSLVWPKYVVDAPNWVGRACGLANQPAVNGILLIVGYAIALTLASLKNTPRWRQIVYYAVAGACAYATYLTRTRAVWLGLAAIVLIGVALAKGYRSGFVYTLLGAALMIGLHWSTFTSSDRDAGGVASEGEVEDRLNAAATAWWMFKHQPWSGWGVGRFTSVNTYRHLQWSPDVDWERGLGIPAHFNELGILAELGFVGIVLWVAVLLMVSWNLYRSFRVLPPEGLMGRRLAFIAVCAFVALFEGGCFVDLRMFDIPSSLVFGLVGAAVGAADRYAPRAKLQDPFASEVEAVHS